MVDVTSACLHCHRMLKYRLTEPPVWLFTACFAAYSALIQKCKVTLWHLGCLSVTPFILTSVQPNECITTELCVLGRRCQWKTIYLQVRFPPQEVIWFNTSSLPFYSRLQYYLAAGLFFHPCSLCKVYSSFMSSILLAWASVHGHYRVYFHLSFSSVTHIRWSQQPLNKST